MTVNRELILPTLLSVVSVGISLGATVHVILRKRDTKSAIGWIGLIWLSPFVGTGLYVLFGINRIRRRAESLRRGRPKLQHRQDEPATSEQIRKALGPEDAHLADLARLVGRFTPFPLRGGNEFEPLHSGDAAYPRMLDAIARAERSVALSSYIFNDDLMGQEFVTALGSAVARGVNVRVLVDDIGSRYDLPRIFGPLRRAGVTAAAFLPGLLPTFMPYFNLRNHRKILVVDGAIGFTGGLNIDKDYDSRFSSKFPKVDLHFRLRGPAVETLFQVFADDWHFATGERLAGDPWRAEPGTPGTTFARGIADGPDEPNDPLHNTILGALSFARSSIQIVSPYFLPDNVLIATLNLAALRGVEVDIFLPSKNNLNLVQWACNANLLELLRAGCRVWYTPPPFDHTKLMIVDGAWTMLGSANWDTRSFRLNFEFNLECYDRNLADQLRPMIDDRLARARPASLDDFENRSLPQKLRDGTARLLSPYL